MIYRNKSIRIIKIFQFFIYRMADFLNSKEARFLILNGKASEETVKSAANVRASCDDLFCEFVAATTHLGGLDSKSFQEIRESKSKIQLTIFLQKIDSK